MPQKLKCDLALEMDFFPFVDATTEAKFFVSFCYYNEECCSNSQEFRISDYKSTLKVETKTLSFAVSKPIE